MRDAIASKNKHENMALGLLNKMGNFVHPSHASRPLNLLRNGNIYGLAGQRKYLTAAERKRFIAAAEMAPPSVRTFCLTLAYCGCRITEALNLTLADIELESGIIAVRCLKKRGVPMIRQIPVPEALLAEILRVHGNGHGRLWPWCRTRAWQHVKGIMASAGIESLPASPKGLRHGFGVHAIACGIPLHLVQRWLGHADIKTTAIYTHVLGAEEREIATRMW